MSNLDSPSKATRWSLVLVSYTSLFFLGLLDNARGPFYPDITSDLQLTQLQASLFFAVASTVAYFSGLMTTRFIKMFGLNGTLRMGQILMGMGFASIAFAQGVLSLVLTCALFGFGFGLLNITQNLFIIEGASPHHRRRLFSGLHAMYAFSSLLAPLVAAYFFRANLSWRHAYIMFGLAVIIALGISFFSTAKKVHVPEEDVRVPKALKPKFLLVAAMLSSYVIGELALSTRLALFLRETQNFTPERAAEYTSYFFIFLFVGRLFFTFVALQKIKTVQILFWSLFLSMLCFAAGIYWHPLFLCLTGLAMAPVFAMNIEYLAELFPRRSTQAVTYCLAFSAVFIVSLHLAMGGLTDFFGIDKSIWLGPASLLASWLLLFRCEKMRQDSDLARY